MSAGKRRQTSHHNNAKSGKQRNATSSTRGSYYEQQAEAYLQRRGLVPIQRNYRCRCGEIDLVMMHGDTLVFVEVKYRKHQGYGNTIEQVTWHKRRKLLNSALLYLASHPHLQQRGWRLDIVGITGADNEPQFQWLQNALTYD